MTSPTPDRPSIERRPLPALAIGISGHRRIGVEGPAADALTTTLDDVLARLTGAAKAAVASDPAFFSTAAPVVRLIGMAADGADLLCARVARARGAEIGCVLPFPLAEYRRDFEGEAARAHMESVVAAATATFILPGVRAEGERAYERANEVILANIDILIAVWDGKRANRRAGTGDVVQGAVSRGIPVVVIAPEGAGPPRLLVRAAEEALATPTATDLVPSPLDDDLTEFVADILLPPRGSAPRLGIADLIDEKPKRWNLRREYPILLSIFRTHRLPPALARIPPDREPAEVAVENPQLAARIAELDRHIAWIDHLAGYYALLYRSSATSEFLIIIVSAFVASVVMLTFPNITGASVFAQTAIGALVVFDISVRVKRRWHERWLDYRLIAERLRCLRFLHPLGRSLPPVPAHAGRPRQSWVDWYIARVERGRGAPTGTVDQAVLDAAWRQLVDVEIPSQLAYHRKSFGQLGLLERRLSAVASVSIYLTIAVAVAFGIWALHEGGFEAVHWRPYAIILLFVLPAAVTAFNGFRADADLVRLVERSAITSAALGRLQRAVRAAPPDYDHVAIAAERVAMIMGAELSEWRFVLESRRVRTKHRNALGRANLRRKLQRWIKPSQRPDQPPPDQAARP